MEPLSSPGPRSQRIKYSVGDRVMRKPTPNVLGSNSVLPDRKEQGTVVEIIYKKNRRGAKMPYVLVKWDNSQRTEQHMSMRIKHVVND